MEQFTLGKRAVDQLDATQKAWGMLAQEQKVRDEVDGWGIEPENHKAMRCNCLLKGALAGGGTFTVDNVVVLDGGISPLTDPTDMTEELTVANIFVWYGDDNAPCKIEWNPAANGGSGQWEPYQLKCPVV